MTAQVLKHRFLPEGAVVDIDTSQPYRVGRFNSRTRRSFVENGSWRIHHFNWNEVLMVKLTGVTEYPKNGWVIPRNYSEFFTKGGQSYAQISEKASADLTFL